ncbi:MAG: hypothetical protein LBG17_06135 [Bacteroidales bacterium]|nr:hypothetical protein [Bacteroidales bacterium]
MLRKLLLIFVCVCCCTCKQEDCLERQIKFEQGDIIFRRGYGLKSRAILNVDTSSAYSHCGIVVLTEDKGSASVIHITPGERNKDENVDKIKIESIADFWRNDKAKHGAVYRLKNNRWGENAAQEAFRLLEKCILFDHDYQLQDTCTMYCTELVYQAYLKAGKDITFGKRSVLNVPMYSGTYIFPSDIYTNDDFMVIFSF